MQTPIQTVSFSSFISVSKDLRGAMSRGKVYYGNKLAT